jgi:hypothetical protein
MNRDVLDAFGDYVLRFLFFVAATIAFSIALGLVVISFPIALIATFRTSPTLARAWTDTLEIYGVRSERP